jgi:3',5'-cyclic AMP phosphodiesterase CpdA
MRLPGFRRAGLWALPALAALLAIVWAGAQGGGPAPDRIVLCPTADPSTGVNVTWRGPAGLSSASAEIAEETGSPTVGSAARTVSAAPVELDLGSTKVNHFNASFTGLKPDTAYAYRVANGKSWSEWFTFRTAASTSKPFRFLYFGDEQTAIGSLCSRVVRQAFRTAPDARLKLHAGDLTNTASSDTEWGEWFSLAGFLNASTLTVPAIGNHQYERVAPDSSERRLTRHWQAQFELPHNGLAGLEDSCYYFDYQGVRFVVLNTMERVVEQSLWLDKVLTGNPNRWTVVMFHHPIFSGAKNRDNAEIRKELKPVLDAHKVDLVLTGHDHVYGRSNPKEGPAAGHTIYVVSVTGAKQYDAGDHKWAARFGQDLQLYQVVSVDGDRLTFEAYTAAGDVYDRFEIVKKSDKATFAAARNLGPERLRARK